MEERNVRSISTFIKRHGITKKNGKKVLKRKRRVKFYKLEDSFPKT